MNINRKLIIRLFAVWIVLSLLIGPIVLRIETKRLDEYVLNLAVQESEELTIENQQLLNSASLADRNILREKSWYHIQNKHFVIVNLYNKNKQRIIEAYNPKIKPFMNVLKNYMRVNVMDDRIHYKLFNVEKNRYLMVMMPLKDDQAHVLGYFEAVYKVNPQTIETINNRLLFSLLQVVIIIFITTAVIYPLITLLNRGLIKLTVDLSKANIGILKVLGNAIAKRDSDTNKHNYRVSIYAIRIAEYLGLQKKDIQGLIKGAFLHDVGKIAISDNILLKPGKLTGEEFDMMKTHVLHGVDIIKNYDWLHDAVDVVCHHHEKFDGTGYIQNLKGDEISLNARIFAIADVFDALTSKRPYKEPFPFEKAMRIINEGREKHFDPHLIDAFNEIAESLYAEVSASDGNTLEGILDGLISKYFPPT